MDLVAELCPHFYCECLTVSAMNQTSVNKHADIVINLVDKLAS